MGVGVDTTYEISAVALRPVYTGRGWELICKSVGGKNNNLFQKSATDANFLRFFFLLSV